MKTVVIVLLSAVAVSAVQVNYVAPVASGYIYRSDNNGPASLIQLGAVPYGQQQEIPYHHPQAFASPLTAQPLQQGAVEGYGLEPQPLPYIVAQPIVVEDAEGDDDDDDDDDSSDESSDEYLDGGDLIGQDYGHAHEKGAGSEFGEEYHEVEGEKGDKGYDSKDYNNKGESGHYGGKHNAGFYSEGEGEKKAYHDEADAHGKHYESGENYKGGNHGHKNHFSKGEDITGYHKIFNKDEFKKDHDFYDVADNSGHFNKHGYQQSKHDSESGGHKEDGNHDSAYNKDSFGETGIYDKGHFDGSNAGHSAEEGQEAYYNGHEDFGKKGSSGHGKQYHYGETSDEDKY